MKKTYFIICSIIIFISSCNTGSNGNTMTIAIDNVVSTIANVIYVEAYNCSFSSKEYVGTYNDTTEMFNFSVLGDSVSVSGSNIQLYICAGDLIGTYNETTVSCSLAKSGSLCYCNAASDATADQITAAEKITEGVQVVIDKSLSAKNSLFNNPNLCTSQTFDVNPRYICPCNLI